MSTKTPFSQRQRPALFWTLVELATLADGWLEPGLARKVPGTRAQIMAALRRAVTALSHASEGTQTAQQLARVRVAMVHCEANFIVFHREAPGIVDEAIRRIDQIVAGLADLQGLKPTEWPRVKLGPLTPAEPRPPRGRTLMTVLRSLAQPWSRTPVEEPTEGGAQAEGQPRKGEPSSPPDSDHDDGST